MKSLTGIQHTANISLTWGKGKNSRKWRDLVQKAYGNHLGKFLRFASMKFGAVNYTFHVYENAAFLIKETSSKGGQVTHFGYGSFSGTKALRWKIKSGVWVSGKGHELHPLGSVTSVKDLFKSNPSDPVEDKPKPTKAPQPISEQLIQQAADDFKERTGKTVSMDDLVFSLYKDQAFFSVVDKSAKLGFTGVALSDSIGKLFNARGVTYTKGDYGHLTFPELSEKGMAYTKKLLKQISYRLTGADYCIDVENAAWLEIHVNNIAKVIAAAMKMKGEPANLQEKWQPTIDKIKAHAKKNNFNVTRYRLKATDYSLTLCVGRDNELFDEGERGDDVLGQYQSKLNFEIAADTSGGGVEVVNW